MTAETYTDRAGRERDTETHALVQREPVYDIDAPDSDCECRWGGGSAGIPLHQTLICPGHKALALLADLKSQIEATL